MKCRLRSAIEALPANLVDNAIHYGNTVTVQDTPGSLTLRFLDEGPGIPEAELERVFEPFYRLEHLRSRDTGAAVS